LHLLGFNKEPVHLPETRHVKKSDFKRALEAIDGDAEIGCLTVTTTLGNNGGTFEQLCIRGALFSKD